MKPLCWAMATLLLLSCGADHQYQSASELCAKSCEPGRMSRYDGCSTNCECAPK